MFVSIPDREKNKMGRDKFDCFIETPDDIRFKKLPQSQRVRLASHSWDTHQFITYVAKILLEERMG